MIVLYDGDCGVCRVSVALLLRWDRSGSLEPVTLQSERAARLLIGMNEATRMASSHVVLADGRILSGAAAAPEVLKSLPGGRALAAIARRLPRTTGRFYRAVAGNRDRIGPLLPPRVGDWARRELKRHHMRGPTRAT
ncbi:MAG TPA: DCC1-like thiol-disulfide oxidoreductase family protein [Solirubrobacterales bacterium]|jgi:predicted DCC family thiol-disulfide oxidoreductase YuxK|nr:DCC1-like thiol-disulfide oxidoreductase family protein [Solirubrobacterales bacterium]